MKQLLILLFALVMCYTPSSAQQTKRQLIKKLNSVYELIDDNYVEDVPLEPLVEEAIRTTLKSLDPHSSYLSKEEMEVSNRRIKGKFAGIGISYIIHNDTLVVRSIFEDSPASFALIQPNDRIIAVNGQSIIGRDYKSIKTLLDGEVGSMVSLTIIPHKGSKPTIVNLKRKNIRNNPVTALRIDSIGYISISSFTNTLLSDFRTAYSTLGDIKALVIDLRDNGGGYLTSGIDLASLFLSRKESVVIIKNRRREFAFRNPSDGELKDMPLVVLINENTASASEIFAGAIQDQDRGTIIGRTSYGKGLIQRIIKYKDGSGIRITTAKYMTPSGRPIQRPYTLGNDDAYHSDSTRFLHPDSIHHADSLKFRTLKRGREVYAGGGITPDIYIEKRSANLSDCVKKSLSDAIVEHTEIEFWNTSSISDMLTRYPTIECFANEYVVSTELWDILFGLGGYSAEDITDTDREYLETMLCAAIAERLYGIEARYYINICRSDYMAQQAISIATSSRKF